MSPLDTSLKTSLESSALANHDNLPYLTLSQSEVESLQGKTVTFKVAVTNFLGLAGYNETTLTFSSSKKLEILDLEPIYTFNPRDSNRLRPRIRIPYCSSDSTANLISEHTKLSYTC